MRLGRRRSRRDHPTNPAELDLRALWGDDEEWPEPSDRAGPDTTDEATPDRDEAGPAGRDPILDEGGRTPAGAEDAAAQPAPDAATVAAPAPARPAGGRRQAVGVGALAILLAAGIAADRAVGSAGQEAAAAPVPAMPTVGPPGALSTSWFCPPAGAAVTSPAQGSVVVANPGPAAISATVTVVPGQGAPVVQHPVIAPYSRVTIRLGDVAPGDYAAATVSFDGPGGAVDEEVSGPLGQSITSCASATSEHWYFPTGATDANASEYLMLYNPYAAPALADLQFATDQGLAIPDAFQGVVVPGGGFNVIDVGARVRSRAQVAAQVDVRGGRLVVDELQVLSDPARFGPHGLALLLGAPAPGTSWYYADGGVGPGVTERFDLFNPGLAEAQVSVAPILEQGSADPFELTVPPQDYVSLEVDQQPRIPPGVGQAWVVSSDNGVPIVADRVITSRPPATSTGVAEAIGAPTTAPRWVFAAGSAGGGQDEWLVVANPGGVAAHVDVVVSGSGQAVRLPGLTIAAESRQGIDVGRFGAGATVVLEVTSDVPVVAERAQYVVSGPGLSDGTGAAG